MDGHAWGFVEAFKIGQADWLYRWWGALYGAGDGLNVAAGSIATTFTEIGV
jgi:hypothetical protein